MLNLDNKKIIIVVVGLVLGMASYLVVLAQIQPPVVPPPLGGPGPIASPEEAISLLRQILVWFAIIFWILAVLMIFWAAFKFLTSGGEDEKIKQAKKLLFYAVVAIAVGLMAYALPTFVDRVLRSRA